MIIQAALNFAAQGLPVFPCGQDKRPLVAGGFKAATTDSKQISDWWEKHPSAMIGVPTGAASGLVVLDIDKRPGLDGDDALWLLKQKLGALPETIEALTPSGGRHLYFKHPEKPIPCSAGTLGPGLDVRGDGGYVIVPPSVNGAGNYLWEGSSEPGEVEYAELPLAWRVRLTREEQSTDTSALAGSDKWTARIQAISTGTSYHDPLTKLAAHYIRKSVAPQEVECLLAAFMNSSAGPRDRRWQDRVAEIPDIVSSAHRKFGTIAATEDALAIAPNPPSLEEFLNFHFPESERLIGPFRSQQIGFIYAAAGVGKTQLGIAMAVHLAHGRDLCHWSVPRRCAVLFVDGEMPGRLLQDRFRLYPVEKDAPLRIVNAVTWAANQGLPHPNFGEIAWQTRLLEWGAESEVIILDNVMSLISVPGVSLNSDEFWKPAHDFGIRARAAGKTVIWIDHANSQEQVFGTKTKIWNADLAVHLKKTPEKDASAGCSFTIVFTKTRGHYGDEVASFEASLGQDADGYALWTVSFEEEQKAHKIIALKDSGMSQRKIAEEVECSVAYVNKVLKNVREK